MTQEDRELGFTGLVRAGHAPEQAWAAIRQDYQDPEVRAMIDSLRATEDGQAVLEYSRQQWAAHGFKPPWDDDQEAT